MGQTQTQKAVGSVKEELDTIRQLTVALRDVLMQQREMLKESGFRLPPNTTTTFNDITRRIDQLSNRLGGLEHERNQYRALADVAALINSSLDLTQVLNETMDTIIKLTGAERGYLMLRTENAEDMETVVARNMDRQTINSSGFEYSRSVVRQAAETGEAIMSSDAQGDEAWKNAKSVVGLSLRAILCVPLKLKDEVTGVIYTDNKTLTGLFTEQTRELLQAFANQAAVAIENARLFARVKASLDEISEMKNLQDNIFASIASGVITTDTDERVTLINRRAQQILALDDQNEQTGTNLKELFPLVDNRFDIIVDQARRSDQRLTGVEFETDLEERGHINLSMNFSPLKDAHEKTQGVAIVLDDMTEIKQREAQIAGVRRYLPTEVVDGIKSAASLKLGGTRQLISILFADIRGFSTFSEKLDPEKLVEIINVYMTIASDAIHMQQGVIDKFMGDAVMALYNTPLRPQEDHAIRAVRSAAGMMADMRAYHETVSEHDRLKFGIGVHTGIGIVGNVGSPDRLDYTAMGDAVNLAKRLQENAKPLQVLLSDETYQLVKDRVQVNELEPIKVKGREQLTKVYELVKVR